MALKDEIKGAIFLFLFIDPAAKPLTLHPHTQDLPFDKPDGKEPDF